MKWKCGMVEYRMFKCLIVEMFEGYKWQGILLQY